MALGVDKRSYLTQENTAVALNQEHLDKVRDEHLKYSVRLQNLSGLRREESIKFIVS